MTRNELIEKCPDEFKEELEEFLNEIYNILDDNLESLNRINSFRNLDIIGDVYDELVSFKDSLY